MKSKIYFILCISMMGIAACSTSTADSDTHNKGKIFIGEWQETKNPNVAWKIEESSPGKFKGTRIGEVGFYKKETETWHVVHQNNVLKLLSDDKDGTTITYIPQQQMLLRHPPGNSYKRKRK